MDTEKEFLYKELIDEIIELVCCVRNTLGCGQCLPVFIYGF